MLQTRRRRGCDAFTSMVTDKSRQTSPKLENRVTSFFVLYFCTIPPGLTKWSSRVKTRQITSRGLGKQGFCRCWVGFLFGRVPLFSRAHACTYLCMCCACVYVCVCMCMVCVCVCVICMCCIVCKIPSNIFMFCDMDTHDCGCQALSPQFRESQICVGTLVFRRWFNHIIRTHEQQRRCQSLAPFVFPRW